jgi:hypothetical protein
MTRRKTICGVNCYILFTRAEYHSLVFVICVKNLYDHYVIHLEMYDVFLRIQVLYNFLYYYRRFTIRLKIKRNNTKPYRYQLSNRCCTKQLSN